MTPPAIEVSHLTKVFPSAASGGTRNSVSRLEHSHQTIAVEDVSFSVAQGEITGLLGPNGAGKTTLLQMMLGLVTPTSGRISILGLDLATCRNAILGQVNFSSTYVSMPTSLTLYENLSVFAALYAVPRTRMDPLLDLLEIGHLKHKLTRELSSGQLTRLSLVKALLNNPKVLFLDEPTASLDPDIADKTRTLLMGVRDTYHTTIFYTSHNMREMEQISDRILLLRQGRLLAADTPKALLSQFHEDHLEALFLKVARELRGS